MEEAMRRVAERKIEEAIEQGAFEDLPDKGKPLSVDWDETVEMRLLRQAGALPEWMALDLEVRREQERIASLRQSACRLPQARLPKRRDAIVAAMRNVNSLILRLNLVRPPSVPERQPYRIADEKKRIEAEFGLAAGSSASPVLTDSSDARRLRSSARSLYAAGHPRPR